MSSFASLIRRGPPLLAAVALAALAGAPSADACTLGGCPNWPSDCYNLKSTKWCAQNGVSTVNLQNLGSYESAFDWARAEASDPHNGIANSLKLNQVSSGGQIKVYDYTGTADWWGLADQYTTSNGTCMTSARIQINKQYMTTTVRRQYTMLHEMGHAVGLNHVCVCPRTMNPCGTCGDDATSSTPWLKSCDAKGLAAKYPGDDTTSTTTTDPNPADEALYQSHLLDYSAHSDVDGDGVSDACARSSTGVQCHLSSGSAFPSTIDGPALSDASGWGDVDNASTLRMLDMDADGRADLCARANAGIRCWKSTGAGFSAAITGPELSDATSWDDPMYFTTLRAADFNGDGKDDLCVRGAANFRCYPSTGSGFGGSVAGPALSNTAGWSKLDRYATIQMGDVDGNGMADVCARDASGMKCWLSSGSGFATEIAGPAWSDASGWSAAQYYATIRLADVDGDGKADLCARAAAGYRCHLSSGSAFGSAILGPTWSTDTGWGEYDNYSTIRLGDLDGDGDLDVCARANAGIRCARWTGSGFGTAFNGPELSDTKGWNLPEYFRTLRLADVNGDAKADLCARAGAGLSCWLSTDTGFGTQITAPVWADTAGWKDPKYYATIRIAGTASLGSGGSAGSAGAPGSGGSAGSGSGGSAGSGGGGSAGSASGGSAGSASGGSAGSASGGSAGSASGGSAGASGTLGSGGSGWSGSSNNTVAGAAGATASPGADSDSSGSCSMAASTRSSRSALLVLLVIAGALARRRRAHG